MSEENSAPADHAPEEGAASGFSVRLENFAGPFDLLLNLIGKRELDITEVSLAQVADEFIAYIRAMQADGDQRLSGNALDEASEFLVVAATLLDLKAARLLPQGEVESDEDIAALEARDLLFARLLQYKAFKEAAVAMGGALAEQAASFPRQVSLEAPFTALLPELIFSFTPEQFAQIAAKALTPKDPLPTEVGLTHLHSAAVSVKEQAEILADRLKHGKPLSFRVLVADAENTLTVVVRFLALLEMYRDAVISFDQVGPLAELNVRWSAEGTQWSAEQVVEEYDAGAAAPREGADQS